MKAPGMLAAIHGELHRGERHFHLLHGHPPQNMVASGQMSPLPAAMEPGRGGRGPTPPVPYLYSIPRRLIREKKRRSKCPTLSLSLKNQATLTCWEWRWSQPEDGGRRRRPSSLGALDRGRPPSRTQGCTPRRRRARGRGGRRQQLLLIHLVLANDARPPPLAAGVS